MSKNEEVDKINVKNTLNSLRDIKVRLRKFKITSLSYHSSTVPSHFEFLSIFNKFSLFITDMRSLIQQLESMKYSTIIYVFSNSSKKVEENLVKEPEIPQRLGDFFGYCEVLSSELSILYNKNIIFWPCPKMKVSSCRN